MEIWLEVPRLYLGKLKTKAGGSMPLQRLEYKIMGVRSDNGLTAVTFRCHWLEKRAIELSSLGTPFPNSMCHLGIRKIKFIHNQLSSGFSKEWTEN